VGVAMNDFFSVTDAKTCCTHLTELFRSLGRDVLITTKERTWTEGENYRETYLLQLLSIKWRQQIP
jgi:hypothetical protein